MIREGITESSTRKVQKRVPRNRSSQFKISAHLSVGIEADGEEKNLSSNHDHLRFNLGGDALNATPSLANSGFPQLGCACPRLQHQLIVLVADPAGKTRSAASGAGRS